VKILLDYNNVMAERVGPENGIASSELQQNIEKWKDIREALEKDRDEGKADFLNLPYQETVAGEIEAYCSRVRGRFKNFVVVGIGGSALGNIAERSALNHPYHNLLTGEQRGGAPRIFVPDNVDPERMAGLLDVIDPAETLFNVITKSGQTAETLANFAVFLGRLRDRLGKGYADHMVVTTDREKGSLREIATREGFKTFEIPRGVGGRFSVLTPVGLLSAAMGGRDIRKMLGGAGQVDRRCRGAAEEDPAFLYAVIGHILSRVKGKSMSVMMAYSHALRDVADWYRQLLAESLGKRYDLDGREVFVGSTPVKAIGVTDQHSQVQLYVDGPADKWFTFLEVGEARRDVAIPEVFSDIDALAYLQGKGLSELLKAEKRGTELALTEAKRPNVTIEVDRVSEETLGGLFFMLERAVAYGGKLLRVNPYDQPGVEAGKIATYALMGRKGYEDKRLDIEKRSEKQQAYILSVVDSGAA
jgi:glucose-6-phosphate isomerase